MGVMPFLAACHACVLMLYCTPCFRKKHPLVGVKDVCVYTHIIGYKLRNSCPILIIFDTKI